MTDEQETYGLGMLESPADERDWSISDALAIAGIDPVMLPAAYMAPSPYPPVLNQHATPMCVAYSSSTLKGWEDLRDQGAFDFDEPRFFGEIGGTASGAFVRNAMARLLDYGYPVVAVGKADVHRIAAYYRVGISEQEIKAAILAFGPVILSVRWPHSWFRPVGGVLPAPDAIVGGHAIVAIGWGSLGLRLRNSWGTTWGMGGEAIMPWEWIGQVKEVWKAVDQIIAPPTRRVYRLHVAHNAIVRIAHVTPTGKISGWTTRAWTGHASTAPCKRPVVKKGTVRGQALVAYVTAGAFRGQWIGIGRGVTVTSKEVPA